MPSLYDESWASIFKLQFEQPYLTQLSQYVQQERHEFQVFPEAKLVFNAFRLTSFDNVKVVILGQDPYHNVGQAHGLSFSVPEGIMFPPSLNNIFKELEQDVAGFKTPRSGDLSSWAKQGVLLMNATLTVRAHQPNSHQNKGWEKFTDAIIQEISTKTSGVVFILWGASAIRKSSLINQEKHLILSSVHPSPLSAYRGFFGSRPFSKANNYLKSKGKEPIDWVL